MAYIRQSTAMLEEAKTTDNTSKYQHYTNNCNKYSKSHRSEENVCQTNLQDTWQHAMLQNFQIYRVAQKKRPEH